MSTTVSYFREKQLHKLKIAVAENLEVYRTGNSDWPSFFEGEGFLHPTTIPMADDLVLHMPKDKDKDKNKGKDENTMDAENCVLVYEALKNLTPQQATDERVWAYLTHFQFWEYVQKRWPLPKDPEKAKRSVLAHYFISGSRGFFRDNAISRLWWMGWIASRCPHFAIERTLEILLHKSDVRANLLERSSFAMSEEIFNVVMKRLGESYDSEDKGLFERKPFREFMKRLNRRGGKVVLNALEEKQLDSLTVEMLPNNQSA